MAEIGHITVPLNYEITQTSKAILKDLIAETLLQPDIKSRIAKIDAEINGPLVEVGQIYGRPLYIRDDIHDPVQLRYVVEQIQSAFRAAFYSPTKDEESEPTHG